MFFCFILSLKVHLYFQVIIAQPDCTYNTSITIRKGCIMIDYKHIGARIRAVRMEKKITQEQLAEAVGVGTSHISHIETGNGKASLETLIQIINALDCSADELFCLEVKSAKPFLNNWLSEIVADCDPAETKLILDTVTALKSSLRRLKITEE